MRKIDYQEKGRWLIIDYQPTSLFSLRMTHATSKGGKTLLVPTPYCVKLALIDACFRKYGVDEAHSTAVNVYETVKDKPVRFHPPSHCVVHNTFIKIKQEERNAPKGIFAPTIAYREFCYFDGLLKVAIGVADLADDFVNELAGLFARINYLGKRGSFMQFRGAKVHKGGLPAGYTCPAAEADIVNGGYRTTHYLDDFGEALIRDKHGFDRVNSYGGKPSALGKFRVLVPTMLPYRHESSGKHYTHYRRV